MNSNGSHDPLVYDYHVKLPFEATFDDSTSTEWMRRNWQQSVSIAALYVIVIFCTQHFMSFNKRFDNLRIAAVCWNSGLALFSVLGMVRMLPEFVGSIGNGFEYSVCNNSFCQGVPLCWATLFGLSKVVELGDTMFLLLKRKKPVFLHWYHHVTVLIYTWYSVQEHTASGRWFIVMNLIVHTVMYTYYALHEYGIRVPRHWAMTITIMQLTQMMIGCSINIYVWYVKQQGRRCDQSDTNLYAGLLMYASYFVLFAQFFIARYHNTKPSAQTQNGHVTTIRADKHKQG